MSNILNGKELATNIREGLAKEVDGLTAKGIEVGLAVVIVGNNPASRIYVNMKKKACSDIGINSYEHALDESTSEQELLALIRKLNKDPKINGILVQLPLPKHIPEDHIIWEIDPIKDVDGFHPFNTGRLATGNPLFIPCTPYGVIELIKLSGVEIEGKKCVVVGRSKIVGRPMSMLLLEKNGTVTTCHSKTKDLKEQTKNADILVVASGNAGFIKKDMVKEGAVVIDVGINRLESGKVVGDVDFEEVSKICGSITPVPGGVGPMTITMLLKNTVKAAKIQNKIKLTE